MSTPLSGRLNPRFVLFGGMALLFALALLLPGMAQPDHYHDFADQRSWLGVPHAGDVLSNLGFVLAGLAGFVALRRANVQTLNSTGRALCALFFVGLLCTGAGSAYYHLAPQNATLVWDRLGMSVVFAGLLGLSVQTRMDDGSARITAVVMLLSAAISAVVWSQTANLMPWVLAQGGGMLIIFALAFMAPRPNELPVALGWVIGLYAVAKVMELSDHYVFELTGHCVSGHSLKHLFGAAAAWPVLSALKQWRDQRQS